MAEYIAIDGAIQLVEGDQVLAYITYSPTEDAEVVAADSTFVDPSLRGKGIADELLDHLVTLMREENKKIKPVCSYVVIKFKRDRQYDDVNADLNN